MSKKIMVLVLAVVSAAFFALPAMSSATELHLEKAEPFSITGVGGELRAIGEPTITCTKTEGIGKYDAGSTTTGTSSLDFTGCHSAVFGITASCKSEGAETAGTIKSSGAFHLITLPGNKPGVVLTTETTKIVCAGISTITTSGNVVGTVISPECGQESKTVTLLFSATATTQNHMTYTEKIYDLTAQTGAGSPVTAALVGEATNTQTNKAKLVCT
jgi:hypothetical protein